MARKVKQVVEVKVEEAKVEVVVASPKVMRMKAEKADDMLTPKMIAARIGKDPKWVRKQLRASKVEGFDWNSHRWHFSLETIQPLFPGLK